MNPLLAAEELPRFDLIEPGHVGPALDQLLAEAEQALATAVSDAVAPRYADLARALDPAVERLQRSWSTVAHLHAVVDSPAWREVFEANLERVIDFSTRLAADARLLAKTRQLAAEDTTLNAVQRKIVADSLCDFVLAGAELTGEQRTRHAQIVARCAVLSQRFGEHVLDATDAWSMFVDDAMLEGVPADVRTQARQAAVAEGRDGNKLTLHAPCRLPLLRHARRRDLREAVFKAHADLCSPLGDPAHDNTALLQELLALRTEQAKLLGLASWAELSLTTKMAATPAEALRFVRELAQRSRPQAKAQAAELAEHAERAFGLVPLWPWDRAYAAEQLRRQRFGVDETQLRPYFPLPHVLAGVLRLVQRLCGVSWHELPAGLWHPDARVYRLERDGVPIGMLTLDLHARAGKQSGAWLDDARHRWRRPDDGRLQQPLAHLVCNFAPPLGTRPALLSHDDVITLLHEVGHALHHLLTTADEWPVSGINGVEWDAAELPSQFMENYAWDWETLQSLSSHVDDGSPLPRALFERLLGSRQFGAALSILRQAEHALFDLLAHGPDGGARPVETLVAEARSEVAVWPEPDGVHYPHSFTHLFDGGYAAGYYGYAWAEVLSADAFEAFEQAGLFDPATCRRWCEQVLATGGSRPALDSFKAFRGRPPRIDAFLRHNGLVDSPQSPR